MNCGGWFSKQDVLKDLRRATGNHVFDFEEGSILVGEQAPPPRYSDFNDETQLQMLRLSGGCKSTTDDNAVTPDLAGITQMLRMVEELQEEPENKKVERNSNSNKNNVLTISKLNPEVKEFLPQSFVNGEKHVKETVTDKTETLKTEVDKTEICDTVSNGRIDRDQLTDTEIKHMRDMLKTKISDTSKTTCVKVKRERNLAIATLVKLYCQTPATSENKPNLITPAYFEKSIQNVPKEECSSQGSVEKLTKETTSTDKITSVDIDNWIDASENKAEPVDIKTKEIEIKEPNKIVKVNNTQPRNEHKSILCLTDIKYVSKAGSSKSVSPKTTEIERVPKTAGYVPSAYAAELTEKYEKHSKLYKDIETDFWDFVHNKIKLREEEIKQKKGCNVESENSVEKRSVTEHPEDILAVQCTNLKDSVSE